MIHLFILENLTVQLKMLRKKQKKNIKNDQKIIIKNKSVSPDKHI